MKKILVVFGTRPEAIKMAPLVKELQKSRNFKTLVCVTGQHRQMLDQVLDLFEIIPDYDLDIMQPEQDLFDITSRILLGMRNILEKVYPDFILVHGDTTTSMVAAMAAYYKQINVGHIEAGLRTHNIYSPWPEEINRQITGRIAQLHFTPTTLSYQNLVHEGIREEKIIITGNTVIDALNYVVKKINSNKDLNNSILMTLSSYNLPNITSEEYKKNRKIILITGHRRENFGQGFINICNAIRNLADKYPDIDFIYPVHLNPNVQKPVYNILSDRLNVYLIKPLEYLPFVYLMMHCYFILTDSGGVQEEAPGLGKPVLVMRDTTERPEAVKAGTVKLTGTACKDIISNFEDLLLNQTTYEQMSKALNPYGDGNACKRIVGKLEEFL